MVFKYTSITLSFVLFKLVSPIPCIIDPKTRKPNCQFIDVCSWPDENGNYSDKRCGLGMFFRLYSRKSSKMIKETVLVKYEDADYLDGFSEKPLQRSELWDLDTFPCDILETLENPWLCLYRQHIAISAKTNLYRFIRKHKKFTVITHGFGGDSDDENYHNFAKGLTAIDDDHMVIQKCLKNSEKHFCII